MRQFSRQLCTTFSLFISIALFSQSQKPIIGKQPAWVTNIKIDYAQIALEKHATDGWIDMDYENQVSLQDQSEYIRHCSKIISEAGVQNGSEISVNFDPTYQQLIFHTVQIRRNNETLNRLKLSNIKTIQQEKELTNFIYDGSLNAVLFLEDVRKGDIIEYSYTIKGFNPIFKNKYTNWQYTSFSSPLYQLYYKLIVPLGRKINIKNLNDTIAAKISMANGQQVYEWNKTNITPTHVQDFTPSWYNSYSQISISEFSSWKDVNDWALQLFPVNKELSGALKGKIAEIVATYKTDEAKAQAALRFVQDDIRYMGIEMGVNSHKPADPSKIFTQRFGDCKEKSYMLCCMLRAMNIEACPVLINTSAKKALYGWLPSATNFDHTTVRLSLDKKYYWLDPTISYQRGSIKDLFYPDYQVGLVITDTTTALTNIAFKNTGYQHVRELFTTGAMIGSGTFEVTTDFKGNFADEVRSSFKSNSNAEMMTSYQKFYATYYEKIKIDSVKYYDNDSTGLFTTKEYYTLPDFWTVEKNNVKKFTFWPFVISSNLRIPKEKDRKMPIRLPIPVMITEEVIVDLPSDWKATESELTLKNNSCEYNSKFTYAGNRVYLRADYENFKDHVSVDDAPKYFQDIKDFNTKEYYELSYGLDGVVGDDSKTTFTNILITILVLGSMIGAFVWWSQRR